METDWMISNNKFLNKLLASSKSNKQIIMGKGRGTGNNWSNYRWLSWYRAQKRKETIKRIINI